MLIQLLKNTQNRFYTLGINSPLRQDISERIQLKPIWKYYSIKTCLV